MTTLNFPVDMDYDFSLGTCIALGNFDGVHIAHQRLIRRAKELAEEKGLICAVYTFSEHPKNIAGQGVQVLTDNKKKTRLVEKLAPDLLIYQDIDESFLMLSPEEFVSEYIVDLLHAKHIVVGRHYTFGYKGLGNAELLKKLGGKLGFEVEIAELVKEGDAVISSTEIRNRLREGELSLVNRWLGRHFSVEGIVQRGNQIGRTLGFPTVNIYTKPECILPRYGVYAAKIKIDGKEFDGIANAGMKPTVNGDRPVVEANIFDNSGDWYGKNAEIFFCEFIRAEKKFSSLEELKNQIGKDCVIAREILSRE